MLSLGESYVFNSVSSCIFFFPPTSFIPNKHADKFCPFMPRVFQNMNI